MASQHSIPDTSNHRRTKSAVLSISSFMHKRNPSVGISIPLNDTLNASPVYPEMPFLPLDHPHSRALGELRQNHQSPPQTSSPTRYKEDNRPNTGGADDATKSLSKKTFSSISLKALAGKEADKSAKTKEPKQPKPKKTKSSTNLATLLSRPKSAKNLRKQAEEEEARCQKNKENRSPAEQAFAISERPPPIYAQFSSEHFTKQPLGGKFLEDEIDLYTPQIHKQRDFYQEQGSQPSLTRRDDGSQRPKSTYLPSSFSIQDISRRVSGSRHSAELIRRVSGTKRPSLERSSTDRSMKSETSQKAAPNRGQRVLAAVTAFGTRVTKSPESETGAVLEDKDIDREFEAMLDRRNIPEHQRGKMRSLALSMKKDFVRQDWAEIAAAKTGRPRTNNSDSSADAAVEGPVEVPVVKTKRPRSRTFTLSRKSSQEPASPTKKDKMEGTLGKHSRKKSQDNMAGGTKSLTASGASVAQTLIAKAKGQLADDFVSYLRKIQKPELVEVGRLHKLRLLLRNETVAWTDDFIRQGGMKEIVGLLHRTMEVEWREEHEDALLHEVLLCLKALSTTALALQHLSLIHSTLFPALLHMIFDEEKKGPSEFTTRNIVTWLLFTYLKSAPISERHQRAQTLLSYLRNPEKEEEERPVPFVLQMRRERPYTVWFKEVSNVTKEVFWIFLHGLNVIALPGKGSLYDPTYDPNTTPSTISSNHSSTSLDPQNPHHIYMSTHFPQERPPVPTAPFVGGVEWDATNYLASHLDLMNGIIASIPQKEDRNKLREEMRISGWEKCMGGTLRLCKEKFYGSVHDGLRCWVAAAHGDGWDTGDVRCGPPAGAKRERSPVKKPAGSGNKSQVDDAPRIEMKLDFGNGNAGGEKRVERTDLWL